MTTPVIAAYVPCYNQPGDVRRAVESVLAQTVPPQRVLVVDDGSEVPAARALAGLPIEIDRHVVNLGRGAARSRAMALLGGAEFVLSCDAGMHLDCAFVERAMP